MARRFAPRLLAGALLLATLQVSGPAAAGTVKSANPWWFADDYLDASAVNPVMTTALVNTASPGTVQLPYAPAQVAYDPAGTYALVATPGGVTAWVFDGQQVRPVSEWSLGSLSGATGVTWLMGGRAFAVATGSQLAVYALSAGGGGYDAVLAAQTSFSGATGLAPGPSDLPSSVLAATASGATVLEAQGTSLVPVGAGIAAGPTNLGVAATSDGSVAATWQAGAVQLWAWNGSAYAPAGAWAPPVPLTTDGPVAAVAFFPQAGAQGGAYWLLTTGGQLLAYSYGPSGVAQMPGMSLSVGTSPALPTGLGAGWNPNGVGVLYPSGWRYEDLGSGGTFGADPLRSLGGQAWPLYVPSAVLQSVVLPIGHTLDMVRVEDATCAGGQQPPNCSQLPTVPAGTSVAYALSTDNCATWTPAPVYTNVSVPAGSSVCYQITLQTTDPSETPVVDVTNLYEIASQTSQETPGGPALLCLGTGCQ